MTKIVVLKLILINLHLGNGRMPLMILFVTHEADDDTNGIT